MPGSALHELPETRKGPAALPCAKDLVLKDLFLKNLFLKDLFFPALPGLLAPART